MENTLHRGYSGEKGGRLIFLLAVPLIFAAAYLYPYLPGHERSFCAIKLGTGIDCPGCGMTRAFSALVHGDIVQGLKYHPLGIVVAVWLLWAWVCSVIGRPVRVTAAAGYVFLAALIGVWITRLVV
jgi:hypothetical protein